MNRTLVVLLLISADVHHARNDTTPPGPLPKPSPGIVQVPCTGNQTADGDALRHAVEGAENATTVLLEPCTYLVAALSRDSYNTGILIGSMSDLTIQGAGQGVTVVKFERPVYIGVEIRSNSTNVTIRNMTIAGSITQSLCTENPELNNPALLCYGSRSSLRPNTTGIGTRQHEGQLGINGVVLTNLEVRDLANGIWIGAGGDCVEKYMNVRVSNNYIHDIHGTYSWSGYGIVNGCAQNAIIRKNTIVHAGRHSIYQPGTAVFNPYPIVIVGNTIVDHGHNEIMSSDQAAISVARSDNITVIDNKIVGGHGNALMVEFADGRNCTRCMLIGNKFVNVGRRNGAPFDIVVTAQAPVPAWFNTRDHNAPPNLSDPGKRLEDVAGAGDLWSGTQAIAAMYDDSTRKDYLYVMKNSRLHRVSPDYGTRPDSAGGWDNYAHSTTEWSDFFGMSADDGKVYVWQGDRLHAVTPQSSTGLWDFTSSSGWHNPGALASNGDGYLYVIQNSVLHRVRPSDWSYVLSSTDWGGNRHSIAAGPPGVVYLRSERRSSQLITVTVGMDRTAWPRTPHDP